MPDPPTGPAWNNGGDAMVGVAFFVGLRTGGGFGDSRFRGDDGGAKITASG